MNEIYLKMESILAPEKKTQCENIYSKTVTVIITVSVLQIRVIFYTIRYVINDKLLIIENLTILLMH